MHYILTAERINDYHRHLILAERSAGTIQKYLHDIRYFHSFLPSDKRVEKETVIRYKQSLLAGHAVNTANSMLAAVNGLFAYLGWHDCRVKPYRQQRRIFRDKSRELSKPEYLRMLKAAKNNGNGRLFYLMETLCATGIRISELKDITVEAVNSGSAQVRCKGKERTVLLSSKLRTALLRYCREKNILSGPVFVTKTGKPLDRSNVWSELKRLCKSAGVDPRKVFPHNFRHLFAVTFYQLNRDIAKLADLLGHASIETTRIYIMESGAAHLRRVERLGLLL